MDRRQLFKGLGAVLAAAAIPLSVAALESLTDSQVLIHLKRVRQETLDKIINPPCIMYEDGRIETLTEQIPMLRDAVRHLSIMIKELEA